MHTYTRLLIIAGVVVFGANIDASFTPKRPKIGEFARSRALILTTPERPIIGRAYETNMLYEGIKDVWSFDRKVREKAVVLQQNMADYHNGQIVAAWGNKNTQLRNIERAMHLVFEFLRLPVMYNRNHELTPEGSIDPIMPDQSLFE